MTPEEREAYERGDIYERERISHRARGRANYHNSKPKKVGDI